MWDLISPTKPVSMTAAQWWQTCIAKRKKSFSKSSFCSRSEQQLCSRQGLKIQKIRRQKCGIMLRWGLYLSHSYLYLKTPIFEWRTDIKKTSVTMRLDHVPRKHRQHSRFNSYQHNWEGLCDHFERNENLPLWPRHITYASQLDQ